VFNYNAGSTGTLTNCTVSGNIASSNVASSLTGEAVESGLVDLGGPWWT
jgi:hypothetical protein